MYSEYYQATILALNTGRFISRHGMLKDLEEDSTSSIWFDEEHANNEISKALKEFND